MANLLELSTIANSSDLKDMMVVIFESENQKDFILTNNMNIVAETLVTRVRERSQLIGELDNCLGSTVAFESAKLLREINEADLAKARAFMTAISLEQLVSAAIGDLKFRDRVFPHKVGLTITSLDLLGVIEDEEYFSKLCDVDAIRVCLLLCLEVIFMGRLLVNEVDDTLMRLIDSLESWNAFPWCDHIWMHLYDEILNVVSNHKSEHLEGLYKSRNYVPTYTLSSFVWAFKVWILESFERSNRWWNKVAEAIPKGVQYPKKAIFKRSDYCTLFCKESNPIFDLRPTLAEYQSEWWTSTIDFLKVYVPRTPIRNPDLFYAYLQKVSAGRKRNRFCRHISTPITNFLRSKITSLKASVIKEINSRIFKLEAIIQVLGRERNGGVVEKLELSDEFCHLSGEFCNELNHDFLELFESAICNSVGTPLDVDTEEEFDEDYILEEEFSMRLEEEESLLLEEERLIEEEKKVRLKEKKRLMIEEERALEVKKRWDEDYRKRSYVFMNSDHMKQAMVQCAPKKRTEFVTVKTDSWLQVCSKFEKKKKDYFGLVDRDMTEFLKSVKP
ncbi:hypothetical protein Tco_0640187 [Tanacetum coccineum]